MSARDSAAPKREAAPFEFVEHTADLCLRLRGEGLAGLFRSAVKGLFHAMKPQWAAETVSRPLRASGRNREELLVNFLNELIFNAETRNEAYESADFEKLDDRRVTARLSGRKTQGFDAHIKAATHHDLSVRRADGFYEAQVVFDL